MSDNLKKRGVRDQIKITIGEHFECNDWAKKFGVVPAVLLNAVHEVGPIVKDVREWLHRQGYIKAID